MHTSETEQYDPRKSRWANVLGQLDDSQEHAALRALVRGEQRLQDVIDTIAGAPTMEQTTPPRISVSAADLAEGIMNLKDDPAALSEWAGFILATTELFVLADEQSEYWDRLFPCIWVLAFGGELRNPAIMLASAVRDSRSWS